MAELSISPAEIRSALNEFVSSYRATDVAGEEVGQVVFAADGIAHVEGLAGTMANELLSFEDGTLGMAMNLEERQIGVVVLGDYTGIEEGQAVRRTGEVLSVPVGDGYLGRVVDPLGNPIDGLGDITDLEGRRALELQAPGVMQRKSVHEPLQTGLKAIDSMIPIGRGQRQLIIGDRQTGKTAIALDTILNQRDNWLSGDPNKQVRCIYVAIGQKGSTIASVRRTLEEAGALEYTTIVASPASDPAGFKYLAPYTGSAIGQHWMYNSKHVLIVFDDLSKQAEAYRAVSLLLRRPPGREAYPGDVFYLHSRLLERCSKLSDDLGGGSMTGLPIIETKANDVSAYIPTNVISITDGQIFLQSDLFNSDQRPAVDVGVSVSRVGGAAQIKAMKKVSGTLKITLAQYRSMQAFAMFASDLDAATRAQLTRGARLMELLKQPQYTPYKVQDQVASVWAGTNGYLDDVALKDVSRFEKEMLNYLHSETDVLETIATTGQLTDEIVFDDLSKQAEAYRAVSLLLRRPPGREAYPGDVFYLHSRLLERCSKLSDDLGGGSMTGLPIIETKANDVSAYIPTNVISITDGQIFLQSDLFNSDQRPAVDVGVSVSRVGGAAQIKAMKKVSGTLKITLAQYRSMQAFAMFASDLDAATRAQLTRGARLMELLKQPQYTPYKVQDQVASVWAGTNGYLDDVALKDVSRFEKEMLNYLHSETDVLETIATTGQLTDETEDKLRKAVEAFRTTFMGDGALLDAEVAELEDAPAAEHTVEQIEVKRG